jgi:hypothetical protein
MLWLLASEYEDGSITASMEEIAFRLHLSQSDLQDALSPLIDAGFFTTSEPLAKPEQSACLEKEDIDKRKRKEEVRSASPPNEDFENLKKVYPRRKGNYAWKAAERKFNALVKTGVDPKVIIAAASRLCDTLRSKIGTEYIPMPASWLNSEDFIDAAVASFEPPAADKLNWDDALAAYVRTGQWSRYAPANNIEEAPLELLAKHGLNSMGRRIQ